MNFIVHYIGDRGLGQPGHNIGRYGLCGLRIIVRHTVRKMSTSGEAADQMAREALQFSEVAIKLTALGFKNSLALALAYAKENPKVRGKTSLDRLLRENKELKVIPIKTEDVSQFKEYARQYGVLFAVIKDKSAQGEKVDIMFKAEDVSKLNRIYEQMGYNIPKAQGQTDRKKAPARNPQGPELRVPEKGSMTYDKRPSVRMKIDHYRAVAKAISETQKALQKGTKEAVTKEAR